MGDQLQWPIRGWEAVEAEALTICELRRFYTPTYPGVHILRGVELSAVQRAKAAWLWSQRQGIIAGLSASARLGAKWIEPHHAAELIHSNRRPAPMLTVHTDALAAGEVHRVDGMRVTTAARTAFDIARRLELDDGVARVDALMNATGVKVSDIEAVAASHPGVRGLGQLRRTLGLVDGGAQSPWETLTRLLFVRNGFPRAESQTTPLGCRTLHAITRTGLALIARGCPRTWGLCGCVRDRGVSRTKPHSHAQLAWPSRTSSDVTDPLISSTVIATSR